MSDDRRSSKVSKVFSVSTEMCGNYLSNHHVAVERPRAHWLLRRLNTLAYLGHNWSAKGHVRDKVTFGSSIANFNLGVRG
jgi:hypothetical protein